MMASVTSTSCKKRKLGAERPVAKYYAVRVGRTPGIYETWNECQQQVAGFKGATYKSFPTYKEAQAFIAGQPVNTVNTKNRRQQKEKFYGVALGHCPGVYTDWCEASNQIQGFSRPKYKKFSTRIEAESFVRSKGVEDSELGQLADERAEEGPAAKKQKIAAPELGANLIVVYTDGSSRGNGTKAARAGVGVYFGEQDSRNVSEPLQGMPQTNQRAELTAILRALQVCPALQDIRIFTDSAYSIKCLTVWYISWSKNNWKNSKGRPVINQDIIKDIRSLMNNRDAAGAHTDLIWVRGHDNDPGNEAADRLAVMGSDSRH